MPITTTYPGVYIEELQSSAMSISNSATAVPVFAIADDDKVFTKATRVTSWLNYMEEKKGIFDITSVRDVSMRSYFENGGGRCYLIPVKALEAEIPKLDDVTLLVAAGQDITSVVAKLCVEGNNLFAILDGPNTIELDDKWSDAYDENANTAIYYPWLSATWSAVNIPPSAAVAGLYCLNDRTRGVWKAPANISLQGGLMPSCKVTDEFQGQHMDGKALNMIRQFGNDSPVIWGARTCKDSDAWRYIPVRRLFNSVEKDIKDAMKIAMFEPNHQPTWERVRSAVNNYLHAIWKQGALTGSSPEEAYFVQIGKDVTMTDDDVKQGKMIVKVGIAAVRPAEFIILQFSQDVAK
ncbi:phage tail sheath C-terminal domain-containing protein [Aeromonas sp. SG16]|uniref:phage tail sheath family protein n=1 Tax=Aeromonas sp. SG16 TaxID=2950548 RepID=UPI00210D6CCB|nr:phage tail sheath C-terminal domain-containing protein [Aeromonas sp. SG16]MCQ4054437.1 phage tail sheath subtilisin-like domain-containing protein [Aeromonas sp. SG16]